MILDDRGHMMVSPSAIEASLHQQLAGQHALLLPVPADFTS